MARRKTPRSMKIEPAVMTFVFTIPNNIPTHYIDLSQVASIVNRRFYRQGLNWAVGGFKVSTPSGVTGSIDVGKLPTTWVMGNAWVKGFHAWKRMNDEVLEETESVRPRFLDFKVFADELHATRGVANNLLPNNSYAVDANVGDWDMSKMSISQSPLSAAPLPAPTNDYEIIATGANYPGVGASGLDSVSLIEGYAASRALPNPENPNVPLDSDDTNSQTPENWIVATFNDGTDQSHEVLENLDADNNKAPYPFEGDGIFADTMYPGGANQMSGVQFHDFELVTSTTVGGTTRLKGGEFPCGLVKFTKSLIGEDPEGYTHLFVDMIPGPHRGYLCESMMEL